MRLVLLAAAITLSCADASAQTSVRTESIKRPAAAGEPAPEIITDLSRLPAPVAAMRERILAAARSGDLQQIVAVMQSKGAMPIFSNSAARDPAAYWRENYPDSAGLEVLSILIGILETPFVHVERGTPQEMYLWPYFARTPLKDLTAAQKVALFRIVTGADYKDMLEAGSYNFYRAGIGPDGTWHFFIGSD